MATTINADTTNGLVMTPDTSGEIKLQSAGTDIATVTSSGVSATTFIPTSSTAPTNGMYLVDSTTVGMSANGTTGAEFETGGNVKFSYNVKIDTDFTNSSRLNVTAPSTSRAITAYRKTTGAGDFVVGVYSDVTSTNTFHCRIDADGDVKNTNNSYGAISDQTVKQQIADANSQLDDIKAIQVRKYKLNSEVETFGDDAPTHIGVIAQELEAAGMNGLVDDDDTETNLKSVKYSVLYMKAIKALQEAITKIEDLETRIQALENA
jgi:hypothetical protein